MLAHGNYIIGPEVKELEKKLAAYIGVKHAVGCASGTGALLMALMAFWNRPGRCDFYFALHVCRYGRDHWPAGRNQVGSLAFQCTLNLMEVDQTRILVWCYSNDLTMVGHYNVTFESSNKCNDCKDNIVTLH